MQPTDTRDDTRANRNVDNPVSSDTPGLHF